MKLFRILFAIDLFIVIFALWQSAMFLNSPLTMTTPQGSTTIPQDRWLAVWAVILVLLFAAVFLGGAATLHGRGRTGLATILLLIPAVPIVLSGILWVGLMIVFIIGTPSR